MKSLKFFEPSTVPSEVLRYSSPVKQLAVGSPGKLGGLKLEFFKDGERTVVKGLWKKVPLQVLRAFYYDETQPDMAILYILNPTGGVLQGDRLKIDVSLDSRCKVHLTTQAASKIYRMNADFATQTVNLTLGEDSFLEYMPDQIIPFRNSRFFQEVNVTVRLGSTFAYWEILTSGRQGRERFDFDIFYSKLNVQNQVGQPILSDTIVLEPKRSDIHRLGIIEEYDTMGNLYVISEKVRDSTVGKIQSLAPIPQKENKMDLIMGVSPLSLAPGLVVRVLGPSSREVKFLLAKIWNEIRIEILGSPALNIRK